jgi:CheY-like chemotaxis protein
MTARAPSVLCVDDDPKWIRLVSLFLEGRGYRVLTALSGEEAFRLATEQRPDLIVADIAMPGMDGYELCSLLRRNEQTRAIPFVFLSGKDQGADRLKARKIGADDYLAKPCSLESLLQSVETLMDQIEQVRTIPLDRIGMTGRIEDVDLLDLLQALELGQKTGALLLSHGERTATVYFREGVIVEAEIRSPKRQEPLFILLGWKTGRFLFLPDAAPERMPITASAANLLVQDLLALERHERDAADTPTEERPVPTGDPEAALTRHIFARLEDAARPSPHPSTASAPPGTVRIAVVGVARSGKSALIEGVVKDLSPAHWAAVGTEEPTATYRMDFGRVRVSPRAVLHLLAIRAERRFFPLWQQCLPGSLAAVVLLDPRDAGARDHIVSFLKAAGRVAPGLPLHLLLPADAHIEAVAVQTGIPASCVSAGSIADRAFRLNLLDRLLRQQTGYDASAAHRNPSAGPQ